MVETRALPALKVNHVSLWSSAETMAPIAFMKRHLSRGSERKPM
jgi:hypothetical protein